MKNYLITTLISGTVALGGCAVNQPFTAEQQSLIKQHEIVVNKVADDTSEPLIVFDKQNRAGAEVAGVVLGLLTGSYGFTSDGDTPRTRLNTNSAGQLIKSSARKAAAEKIETVTPTNYMQEMLASQFQYVEEGNKELSDQLVINIKPVAWQLFYDKLLNKESAFVLEYAGDITMQLKSAKISRSFPCDKTSETSLTKEEWLANEHLRVRQFAQNLANTCVATILSELGQNTQPN